MPKQPISWQQREKEKDESAGAALDGSVWQDSVEKTSKSEAKILAPKTSTNVDDTSFLAEHGLDATRNNGRSDLARNSAVRPDAMKAKGNRRNAGLTEWHLNNPSKQSMDFLMLPEEEQRRILKASKKEEIKSVSVVQEKTNKNPAGPGAQLLGEGGEKRVKEKSYGTAEEARDVYKSSEKGRQKWSIEGRKIEPNLTPKKMNASEVPEVYVVLKGRTCGVMGHSDVLRATEDLEDAEVVGPWPVPKAKKFWIKYSHKAETVVADEIVKEKRMKDFASSPASMSNVTQRNTEPFLSETSPPKNASTIPETPPVNTKSSMKPANKEMNSVKEPDEDMESKKDVEHRKRITRVITMIHSEEYRMAVRWFSQMNMDQRELVLNNIDDKHQLRFARAISLRSVRPIPWKEGLVGATNSDLEKMSSDEGGAYGKPSEETERTREEEQKKRLDEIVAEEKAAAEAYQKRRAELRKKRRTAARIYKRYLWSESEGDQQKSDDSVSDDDSPEEGRQRRSTWHKRKHKVDKERKRRAKERKEREDRRNRRRRYGRKRRENLQRGRGKYDPVNEFMVSSGDDEMGPSKRYRVKIKQQYETKLQEAQTTQEELLKQIRELRGQSPASAAVDGRRKPVDETTLLDEPSKPKQSDKGDGDNKRDPASSKTERTQRESGGRHADSRTSQPHGARYDKDAERNKRKNDKSELHKSVIKDSLPVSRTNTGSEREDEHSDSNSSQSTGAGETTEMSNWSSKKEVKSNKKTRKGPKARDTDSTDVRRGRKHQGLILPADSLDLPTCKVLNSVDPRERALWQRRFQMYMRKLKRFQDQFGLQYNPPLSKWVNERTWRHLSQYELKPEHRTSPREPPNDEMVKCLLLGTGEYAGIRKPGELQYEDATEDFEALQWPEWRDRSYISAMEEYLDAWNELCSTMAEEDEPPDKEKIKIMSAAIRPTSLSKLISTKIRGGKPPDTNKRTTPWRKKGRKEFAVFVTVMRENIIEQQRLRGPKESWKAREPVSASPDASRLGNYTQYYQGTGGTPKRMPTRGEEPGSPTATGSLGGGTKRSGRNSGGGTKGGDMNSGGGTRESDGDKKSLTAGRDERKDIQEVPPCDLKGCDLPRHRFRNGGLSATCTQDHQERWKQDPTQRKNLEVVMKCALVECDKPRFMWQSSRHLGSCCTPAHYEEYLKRYPHLRNKRKSRRRQVDEDENRESETKRNAADEENIETATQHRVCHFCRESHSVLACSELTEERRRCMEADIGYKHTVFWWNARGNREKVIAYAKAKGWIDPDRQFMQVNAMGSGHHGVAAVGLVKRLAFCDLGGDNNMADMQCYHELCELIRSGKDKMSSVVTPVELGYTNRGVPIDMAGGNGSSVVFVKKWAVTTIRMIMSTGRTILMHQQLVGFVNRDTSLLLLGKRACSLCGFMTIREQEALINERASQGETEPGVINPGHGEMESKITNGGDPGDDAHAQYHHGTMCESRYPSDYGHARRRYYAIRGTDVSGVVMDLGEALARITGDAEFDRFTTMEEARAWIEKGVGTGYAEKSETETGGSAGRSGETLPCQDTMSAGRPLTYFAVRGSRNNGVDTDIQKAILRMNDTTSEMMDFEKEEDAYAWIREWNGRETAEQRKRNNEDTWRSDAKREATHLKSSMAADKARAPIRVKRSRRRQTSTPSAKKKTKKSRSEGEQMKCKRSKQVNSKLPRRVEVRASLIEGAGEGLFLMEDAEEGDWIARFSGDVLDREQCDRLTSAESDYVVKVHNNLYLNGEAKQHWEGRSANDGSISGKRTNARFQCDYRHHICPITGKHWIKIYATRKIKAGEEIYVSYGRAYWARKRRAERALRMKATALATGVATAEPTTKHQHHAKTIGCDNENRGKSTPLTKPDTGEAVCKGDADCAMTTSDIECDLQTQDEVGQEERRAPHDGIVYVGKEAHRQMRSCEFKFSDKVSESYISTAALRRSGCYPEQGERVEESDVKPETTMQRRMRLCKAAGDTRSRPDEFTDEEWVEVLSLRYGGGGQEVDSSDIQARENKSPKVKHPGAHQHVSQDAEMDKWLKGTEKPRSTELAGKKVKVDQALFLQPGESKCEVDDIPFVIVPSDEMRTVVGTKLTDRIDDVLEQDESPLQQKSPTKSAGEIARALNGMYRSIYQQKDIPDCIKEDMCFVLYEKCQSIWSAKFDLQTPAHLPPMEIHLKEGAKPARVKRMYRWTQEQCKFLAKHLKQLEDAGIISATESEWCCPVVLVVKPDLTWRLCVDPSHLNKNTIPMTWEIPRVREELQERVRGSKWFSKFDFVSMFWQVPLHPNSRNLFCFFAGKFGTFRFNRVAMGALNSSIYVQKMVTRMFENVKVDGKPMLGNGLEVLCDDILLHADSPTAMAKLVKLFLNTVKLHGLRIHPGKCELFKKDVVYCGLHVSEQGVTVDPERLQGLQNASPPQTVGDVWQFKSSAGWIRRDVPMFALAEKTLDDFISKALKGKKRRNMKAAAKIALTPANWGKSEKRAWEAIRKSLCQCITTSYRDRRQQACLFTDASHKGWSYVITQCEAEELCKPWLEQRHEILACDSGLFRDAQINWSMSCKEAFPIMVATKKRYHLLQGDVPFACINDHKSLKHIFDAQTRVSTISKASRSRLDRWAMFLRTFPFEAHHIPGEENHLCDLLSRNGCTQAIYECERLRHTEEEADDSMIPPTRGRPNLSPHDQKMRSCDNEKSKESMARQYAIIRPEPPVNNPMLNKKDMDFSNIELLPQMLGNTWPTGEHFYNTQQRHGVGGPNNINIKGKDIVTDARGRIIVPIAAGDLLDNLIAVCHQGDHFHRSSKHTANIFTSNFHISGMSDTAMREYVVNRCRACLACIKTRTGASVPRPYWYMVRSNRPFEYIHADFVDMPETTEEHKYMLVITCDFSLTTVMVPCKKADTQTVVRALLDHWLPYYPDPVLLHTDGGKHLDNAIVKALARERGWGESTVSTPYAKWTHGVAERMNKEVLDTMRSLCRHLKVETNKWHLIIGMVQGALNRKPRPSRGNKSPIELTTSQVPASTVSMMRSEGKDFITVDSDGTQALNRYTAQLAETLERYWQLGDTARRATSKLNRKKSAGYSVPDVGEGDYVLYAVKKEDDKSSEKKLEYTWKGPGVILAQLSPMVYLVKPAGIEHVKPMKIHYKRLRRFANSGLNMTVQIKEDLIRDHEDNKLAKVVAHKHDGVELWCKCRWTGLTARGDSWQTAKCLYEDAPRRLVEYMRLPKTKRDEPLMLFMRENFPVLPEWMAPNNAPRAVGPRPRRGRPRRVVPPARPVGRPRGIPARPGRRPIGRPRAIRQGPARRPVGRPRGPRPGRGGRPIGRPRPGTRTGGRSVGRPRIAPPRRVPTMSRRIETAVNGPRLNRPQPAPALRPMAPTVRRPVGRPRKVLPKMDSESSIIIERPSTSGLEPQRATGRYTLRERKPVQYSQQRKPEQQTIEENEQAQRTIRRSVQSLAQADRMTVNRVKALWNSAMHWGRKGSSLHLKRAVNEMANIASRECNAPRGRGGRGRRIPIEQREALRSNANEHEHNKHKSVCKRTRQAVMDFVQAGLTMGMDAHQCVNRLWNNAVRASKEGVPSKCMSTVTRFVNMIRTWKPDTAAEPHMSVTDTKESQPASSGIHDNEEKLVTSRDDHTSETFNMTTCDAMTTNITKDTTRNERPNGKQRVLQEIGGDILNGDETYLVHQTNCVTETARGLAAHIFARLPHADCYSNRTEEDVPGTLTVKGNNNDCRLVVNLHGQYQPGGPTMTGRDSAECRQSYFRKGLQSLIKHVHRKHPHERVSIAFPKHIGCGLAKGDWGMYESMIQKFDEELRTGHNEYDTVHLYVWDPTTAVAPVRQHASRSASGNSAANNKTTVIQPTTRTTSRSNMAGNPLRKTSSGGGDEPPRKHADVRRAHYLDVDEEVTKRLSRPQATQAYLPPGGIWHFVVRDGRKPYQGIYFSREDAEEAALEGGGSVAVLPNQRSATSYLHRRIDNPLAWDAEPRWVVLTGRKVGVMRARERDEAIRAVPNPVVHGPYSHKDATRMWRARADEACVVRRWKRDRARPEPDHTRNVYRPKMPRTTSTVVACPECGHIYCEEYARTRPNEDGTMWYIRCGLDALEGEFRYCCRCEHGHRPYDWRPPSPPVDVRADSPNTAIEIEITNPHQPLVNPPPPDWRLRRNDVYRERGSHTIPPSPPDTPPASPPDMIPLSPPSAANDGIATAAPDTAMIETDNDTPPSSGMSMSEDDGTADEVTTESDDDTDSHTETTSSEADEIGESDDEVGDGERNTLMAGRTPPRRPYSRDSSSEPEVHVEPVPIQIPDMPPATNSSQEEDEMMNDGKSDE